MTDEQGFSAEADVAADESFAKPAPERADEEDIRLLTGFTDIFSAFVLGGLFIFITALASLAAGFLGGLLVAAAAWFLTRYFVVKRRFAACAILLTVAFGIGVTGTLIPATKWFAPFVAGGALWMYWRQYKIPISAALAIVFATLGPVFLFFNPDSAFNLFDRNSNFNAILLAVGIVLFAVGIYWDVSDRERVTRRSDVAFWLHLAAGPLMVHGTFSLLGLSNAFGIMGGGLNAGQTDVSIWPVFLLVGFFAIVSIIVDRRPLLIASFSYLVFAIGILAYRQLSAGQANGGQQFPAVLMTATMATGTFIVVLAGAWSQIRRLLLSLLPKRMAERLTPVDEWTLPADPNANLPGAEKEPLRLIHGLNDYMAAVGMASLFIGSIAAGIVIATKLIALDGNFRLENPAAAEATFGGIRPWLVIILPMVVVGLLAAFFVRYRRMALTGVAASLQFWLLTIFAIALFSLQYNLPGVTEAAETFKEPVFRSLPIIIGCLFAAAANFMFWRFNLVPIAFALGFAILFPFMFPEFLNDPKSMGNAMFEKAFPLRAAIFGIIAFAAALFWDRKDPTRRTQAADNGFWMHVLAALFFIPSAYSLLGEVADSAMVNLAFFAVLVGLALVIDRRAMLLVALPTLVGSIATNENDALGMTGAVLLFGALTVLNLYWDQIRNHIIPARAVAVE
jgi:hypothetical protein